MADITTEPVPPVPNVYDIVQGSDQQAAPGTNKITIPWSQWFQQLRIKINILNESLVNLAGIVGNGFLVKNGAAWILRTITGTAGKISVTNGDGAAGNPVINLVNTTVIPGSYTSTNLTVDADGRITAATNGSGGGGGGGYSSTQAFIFTDFLDAVSASVSTTLFYPSTTGGGTFSMLSNDLTRPGIARLTKAVTVSQVNINYVNTNVVLSAGATSLEFSIRVNNPPPNGSNTNAYLIDIGYRVVDINNETNNAVFMRALGNSTRTGGLQPITLSAGVNTTNPESAALLAANTWTRIGIVINSTATSAEFFVDGVSIGTIVTNIPGTVGLRPFAQIWTGGGAVGDLITNLDVDYVNFTQVLNTPR